MEHHYTHVNGLRLHYVTAGTGPLMLFVHGWPEFWIAWRNQLPEFARDHTVVAPDTRGVNLSDKPPEVKDYHARHLVEDLRQLIRQLGGGRAIVVAHDWGGAAAWNLAAHHPECVQKLVILNSPHPVMFARALRENAEQQAASQYMLLLRSEKAERVLSENNFERMARQFQAWSSRPNLMDAETLGAYREAWSQPGALTAGLNYYRASPLYPPTPGDPGAAGLNLPEDAFTVRVPTLVIWGERDSALLPCLLDGLDRYVPDLRIERISEGSHWIAHEHPGRVNALIRDFIAK